MGTPGNENCHGEGIWRLRQHSDVSASGEQNCFTVVSLQLQFWMMGQQEMLQA